MRRFSGEKLKQARGKKTQSDLAAELRARGCGTTQTQVSRWESGQVPRRYIRPHLSDVLGIPFDDLYDEVAEADAPFRSAA